MAAARPEQERCVPAAPRAPACSSGSSCSPLLPRCRGLLARAGRRVRGRRWRGAALGGRGSCCCRCWPWRCRRRRSGDPGPQVSAVRGLGCGAGVWDAARGLGYGMRGLGCVGWDARMRELGCGAGLGCGGRARGRCVRYWPGRFVPAGWATSAGKGTLGPAAWPGYLFISPALGEGAAGAALPRLPSRRTARLKVS